MAERLLPGWSLGNLGNEWVSTRGIGRTSQGGVLVILIWGEVNLDPRSYNRCVAKIVSTALLGRVFGLVASTRPRLGVALLIRARDRVEKRQSSHSLWEVGMSTYCI